MVEQIGPMRHQGEHFYVGLSRGNFWGLRGLIFHQKSGECHDIQRKQIKINFLKIVKLILLKTHIYHIYIRIVKVLRLTFYRRKQSL